MPSELEVLFDHLPALGTSWPGGPWSWDLRFQCAVSTFPCARAEEMEHAITLFMPISYTRETLADAPEAIQKIARDTGGLRRNQRIFCGPEVEGRAPWALWWPWMDGATVSVRLGLI